MGFPHFNDSAAAPVRSKLKPKTRQRDKPIEKFSFEAFVAGQSVAKGRGPITAKFERISN